MSITSRSQQIETFFGKTNFDFCRLRWQLLFLDVALNWTIKEAKRENKPSNETAILRLNWTEHFCCFSFLLTYDCQCFLFFSWTDKNKLHVRASSLWATSHLMWPLLSNTAVLPEEGGSQARKHLLWTPRTVVHFFPPQNKLLVLRQRVLVTHQRQSVDRQRLITSGRIHLGTPRLPTTKHLHFVAVDAQPVCQMFARSQTSEAAARERLELYLNVECSGACNDLKQVVPQQEVSDGQKRRK